MEDAKTLTEKIEKLVRDEVEERDRTIAELEWRLTALSRLRWVEKEIEIGRKKALEGKEQKAVQRREAFQDALFGAMEHRSLKEIAALLDTSVPTLRRWLLGEKTPRGIESLTKHLNKLKRSQPNDPADH